MDWIEYYRLAWAARGKVLDALLAEETDLARIFGRFDRFETANRYQTDPETGQCGYVPRPGQHDPLTNLSMPEDGVSCGDQARFLPYVDLNVARMLADFATGAEVVAEIGTGYGRQLFDLWLAGGGAPDTRFVGFEPNDNARALAARLAARLPAMNVTFLPGDFESFDPAPLATTGRVLLFTNFAVMFQERFPVDFFERVARLPPEVLMVFVEPVNQQIGHQDPGGGLAFNVDFVSRFNEAAAAGLIEPIYVGRDLFGRGDKIKRISILTAIKPAVG
ncbi:class I SAM-dependent methyltransferase [Magnetospirillum moscoviense]|uniref:Methyltransferase domain-containing protein n=1 Tax=Magnetospirillum moscoviense TaxID=1437059 RepID=A0A178MV96_9PROT|nr:class I SAM-dependent methyltransferase [Magnetospirillum moscoviense]OAN52795.1 hypothetical protein A6A05_10485 [Magnetospirillum moscoviense]